jgi:hypothetical protein
VTKWTPYRISIPKGSTPSARDGTLLETIYHVVHVPTARRILEDGYLRGGLVHDESRLNKSRICVTWLSANTWALGSIYGNVQFSFPWSVHVRNRRFYWVEAMIDYSPHAYRILLTDRDLSKSKYVREYDPRSNRGPLRERNGDWYWNGSYTSEFMVEGDIDLDDCTGFGFVSHHSDICQLDGASCLDRSATTSRIGGRILAFMLGNALHTIDRVLKCSSQSRKPLHDAVDTGADGIMRAIGIKRERFGGAIKSSSSAQAVLRGALALYGSGKVTAARELIKLLSSPSIFENALTEIVNKHFGTTRWTIPD